MTPPADQVKRSDARRKAALVLSALVLATASAAAGYLAWRLSSQAPSQRDRPSLAEAGLGVDFALTNQHGGVTRLSDLRGGAVLLFFGYTHCPDICPGTLYAISRARALLGEDGERLTGVFVTVDPARDTPARLREYVSFFGAGLLGLTGSEEALAAAARAFGAGFEKGEADASGGYLMGHTTFAYLIDPRGRVVKLYPAHATPEELATGVRQVLEQSG
jgi:protein SCO1/2